MLNKLSNTELDLSLKKSVENERKILHIVLEHIVEVDARKLYLEKSYSSLYEYLVKECQYSGSAAVRRIAAARLLKEVPAISSRIKEGHINLSQIGELSRAIKEKEKSARVEVSTAKKAQILSAIAGTSTAATQKEIAKSLDIALKAPEQTFTQKDESVHLQITLTKEQYEKIIKCRDLGASQLLSDYKDTSLAAVLEFLADKFLVEEANDCSSDNKSFYTQNSLKHNSSQDLKLAPNSAEKPVLDPAISLKNKSKGEAFYATNLRTNKTLTPKTRKVVLHRDKCCQYKDPETGRVCGSTFNLEIDHKKPRWAQGGHSLENLQVLCKGHNNLKYRKEMNLRFF